MSSPSSGNSQFGTLWRFTKKYFRAYGGWPSIFLSPFFIAAVILALSSYHEWRSEKWIDLVYQVIPSLLGFSLGTYALLFSLMSSPIKNALKNVRNKSGVLYIDELNATFLHFIVIQTLSFIWAFESNQTLITDLHNFLMENSLCKWDFMPFLRGFGAFIGVGLFLYAVLLTIAASLAVFRIARLSEPD